MILTTVNCFFSVFSYTYWGLAFMRQATYQKTCPFSDPLRAIGVATVVFDKKECAITSKENKVGGELKKIQPLILTDPESSKDLEDESIEDAVYDEDYRGDHNLTKINIWSVVSISWGAI